MAGLRPAMRSAAIRADPCDMVHPIWPWPQLRKRFENRRLADERQIVRRHRPQACRHFRPVVLGALGKKLLRDPLHEGEVRRLVACVIARELGGRGDPQSIAKARNGDEILFVDAGDRRRGRRCANRNRQRIALYRIDGQADAQSAREDGALRPERQDKDVAGEGAAAGLGDCDLVALGLKPADRRAGYDHAAALDNDACEGASEFGAISGLISRAEYGSGDLVLGVRKCRFERDHLVAIENLDQLTVRLQKLHVLDAGVQRLLAAVQIEDAATAAIVVDHLLGDDTVQHGLRIGGEPVLEQRVAARFRSRAFLDETPGPGVKARIGRELETQRLVSQKERFA